MGQSVGVCGFKHIIKWLYPEAVAAFDGCAAVHDKDYKGVDWSLGADATLEIDRKFWRCCIAAADGDDKLEQDANFFYSMCRKWGIMRAYLWKIGLSY